MAISSEGRLAGLVALLFMLHGSAAFALLKALPRAASPRRFYHARRVVCGATAVEAASEIDAMLQHALLPASAPSPGGATLRLLQLGDLAHMLSVRAASCGTLSKMTLGKREVYFIGSPALVKEICVEKASSFPDREALTDEDQAAGCPMPLGLTLGQYDAWNRSRSILNPSFFRRDELAAHSRVLVENTERMVAHWEERNMTAPIVDLEQDGTALSQSVLLHILFSLDERLWEHSRVSLAPVPLPVRALEEMLAWKWLLHDQIAALFTADRSLFRFVKAFTNRDGQLTALRARSRVALRATADGMRDPRAWVIALLSLPAAIKRIPSVIFTMAGQVGTFCFAILRWLSKEIDVLYDMEYGERPTPSSPPPPSIAANASGSTNGTSTSWLLGTVAEEVGGAGVDVLKVENVQAGAFAGGGRGGAATRTRVLPGAYFPFFLFGGCLPIRACASSTRCNTLQHAATRCNTL